MSKVNQAGWRAALLALALCAAGAAQAQSTTGRDLRQIKVVSVDGNTVVVWDQFGAQEYTVPDDFRFTVDGKPVAAADLKAGMEGTAEITQSATVRPVHVTEIAMGTVVSQVGRSVTVKDENGQVHRFTQSEADERGLRLYMDDKAVRVFELEPGDQLAATIVSTGPPEILTAADVEAELSGAAASAADAGADAAAATESAVAEAGDAAAETADEIAAPDMWWLWILVLLLVIAVVIYLFTRKPRKVVHK